MGLDIGHLAGTARGISVEALLCRLAQAAAKFNRSPEEVAGGPNVSGD